MADRERTQREFNKSWKRRKEENTKMGEGSKLERLTVTVEKGMKGEVSGSSDGKTWSIRLDTLYVIIVNAEYLDSL